MRRFSIVRFSICVALSFALAIAVVSPFWSGSPASVDELVYQTALEATLRDGQVRHLDPTSPDGRE